ncbi:MAG: hypothetical protein F7C32_00660 [Desulfurococcales archaeon]|nr:hypothetical protein [Desulfurococcales archaeon]
MSISVEAKPPSISDEGYIKTTVALIDKSGKPIEDVDLNGGAPEKEQVYTTAVKLYLSASVPNSYGDVEEIIVVYSKGALKILVDEELIRVAASTGHVILM